MMIILTAVLLITLLFVLSVFADDARYTNTLKVPSDIGETDVTASSVYVMGAREPGVLMTAVNQPVSVRVDGNVDAR